MPPPNDAPTDEEKQASVVDAIIAHEEKRIPFSTGKKWGLLAMFSFAMFIDIVNFASCYFFTYPISIDLSIRLEQQSWVITSYSVTFSAFLLFWGRFSDLYSAKYVFAYGFAALGIFNLICSFLVEQYSFFVVRALAGIAAGALVPAAYRLIPHVFEPHELSRAFTIFGMSGSFASIGGTLLSAAFEYIPTGGQGEAWRWFFRFLAVLILPVSMLALKVVPDPESKHEDRSWKKLDIGGSFTMLTAIVLLTVGLTFGATYGWKTAAFLAPLILSLALFGVFFWWEHRLPDDVAVLPSTVWKIPGLALWLWFGLCVYAWWGIEYLALVEFYVNVHHDSPIITALRLAPQALAMLVVATFLSYKPKVVLHTRWAIAIGMACACAGYALFAQSGNQIGVDYWKYVFTGGIIGCGGITVAFTATSVGVMTSVPPEQSGVAGAILQVSFQVGQVVAYAIQAGCFTIHPGGFHNWKNVQASFYFQLGWMGLWTAGFLALYRKPKPVV